MSRLRFLYLSLFLVFLVFICGFVHEFGHVLVLLFLGRRFELVLSWFIFYVEPFGCSYWECVAVASGGLVTTMLFLAALYMLVRDDVFRWALLGFSCGVTAYCLCEVALIAMRLSVIDLTPLISVLSAVSVATSMIVTRKLFLKA